MTVRAFKKRICREKRKPNNGQTTLKFIAKLLNDSAMQFFGFLSLSKVLGNDTLISWSHETQYTLTRLNQGNTSGLGA